MLDKKYNTCYINNVITNNVITNKEKMRMKRMIDDCFIQALRYNSYAIMHEFFGMIKMAYMLNAISMEEFDFLFSAGMALDGDLR